MCSEQQLLTRACRAARPPIPNGKHIWVGIGRLGALSASLPSRGILQPSQDKRRLFAMSKAIPSAYVPADLKYCVYLQYLL